ncbi:MAG: hypothetical protein HQL19_00595 [Candidatus Omnitrophica bacterium]|nr:hypothetical protein [Candidatus Omnitrophota bacterium]
MIGNKETCVSPWFGFLIIAAVCILIAAGIFFEFKGTTHHKRLHKTPVPKTTAAQVAFPQAATGGATTGDKFAF